MPILAACLVAAACGAPSREAATPTTTTGVGGPSGPVPALPPGASGPDDAPSGPDGTPGPGTAAPGGAQEGGGAGGRDTPSSPEGGDPDDAIDCADPPTPRSQEEARRIGEACYPDESDPRPLAETADETTPTELAAAWPHPVAVLRAPEPPPLATERVFVDRRADPRRAVFVYEVAVSADDGDALRIADGGGILVTSSVIDETGGGLGGEPVVVRGRPGELTEVDRYLLLTWTEPDGAHLMVAAARPHWDPDRIVAFAEDLVPNRG